MRYSIDFGDDFGAIWVDFGAIVVDLGRILDGFWEDFGKILFRQY